jgi:hypothetical protein
MKENIFGIQKSENNGDEFYENDESLYSEDLIEYLKHPTILPKRNGWISAFEKGAGVLSIGSQAALSGMAVYNNYHEQERLNQQQRTNSTVQCIEALGGIAKDLYTIHQSASMINEKQTNDEITKQ